MTTEPKYTDAQVQSIIDRVTRENSVDGMDGDSWDRLLVRAAISERQAAMQGQGGEVVPARFLIEKDAWEAAQFAFGGPGTGEGEEFMDCTAWVGDIENDDGSKTYGLHIQCDECPEEGSITLAEFKALQPPQPVRSVSDEDVEAAMDAHNHAIYRNGNNRKLAMRAALEHFAKGKPHDQD